MCQTKISNCTLDLSNCRVVDIHSFEEFKKVVDECRAMHDAGEEVPTIVIDSISELILNF